MRARRIGERILFVIGQIGQGVQGNTNARLGAASRVDHKRTFPYKVTKADLRVIGEMDFYPGALQLGLLPLDLGAHQFLLSADHLFLTAKLFPNAIAKLIGLGASLGADRLGLGFCLDFCLIPHRLGLDFCLSGPIFG